MGFGSTVDLPQAYLVGDITARKNLDAVEAAQQLLKEMGYTYGELFTVLGFSQGGYSAMAVQRYFDTYGADPEVISHIDYTLCGGGPYNIAAVLDSALLEGTRFMYPCAIPLIVQGQIEGEGLDISYSDCFRAPLDTKLIEWLNAKVYSTAQINDSIFRTVGGDGEHGVLASDMLCTENFEEKTGRMRPLFESLAKNSLVSDWQPNDATHYYLYHSGEDEIVPFFCMEQMSDYLKAQGVGEDRLETTKGSGTHVGTAAFFVINAIGKLRSLESRYLEGEYVPVIPVGPSNVDEVTAAAAVSSGWHDLQGRRLTVRPQRPGMYIYNGRKVAVR